MGLKDLFRKKDVADDEINVTEDKAEEAKETQETVKEEAPKAQEIQEAVPQMEQPQQEIPAKMITNERRQEIGPIIFKSHIEESDLEPLSIQETIFLLVSVDHFQEESEEGVENYEEKCELLDRVLAKKLSEAEVLYMTFDAGTNLPYITQGCVEIYSEVEYAQDAVRHYGEQYRAVTICEIRKDDSKLPDKMSVFEFLYYLGMEHLLIDNGRYKTVVNREDVLAVTDKNPEYDLNKPIRNPRFRYALIEFFQEVKWPVTYEKREEVIHEKEDKMLAQLKKARFIVPMLYEGEQQASADRKQVVPEAGRNMAIPKLETADHIAFTPIFSDWTEFIKIYPSDRWNGLVLSFEEAITLNPEIGIVINPAGENLIMNQQSFEALKMREDNQQKEH
ncbi:SseB family protein [[Clostridium] polysaccharolyticum]|uniref:SseB protein N-terminal domain-containing protein n=1 Tax=[Clostridium] polysaccharolyticum TaxID=29364 RepID=A0A1I0G8L0_9FIRM|nr:SseB family protein [[Clostridium] polysaccharolyticum]SET66247.1 SseB protein N-terminal domain-containing protein [[Clostridium] polysaccharolyticum]